MRITYQDVLLPSPVQILPYLDRLLVCMVRPAFLASLATLLFPDNRSQDSCQRVNHQNSAVRPSGDNILVS